MRNFEIIKLSDLNIDFYNMTEAVYHFEDNVNENLEISDQFIEVGVFKK